MEAVIEQCRNGSDVACDLRQSPSPARRPSDLEFSRWLDFLTDHPVWLESEILSAKMCHPSLDDGVAALDHWKSSGRPHSKVPRIPAHQMQELVAQWVMDWKKNQAPD